MALAANQRRVNLNEAYVREKFPALFKDNERIVEVTFQYSMQPGIPGQVIFTVEKVDEEKKED